MFLLDANVPLFAACLAFLVICLLSAGILVHAGRLREKRELLEKIRADERDWGPIEVDAPGLEKSEKSKGPFVKFLHSIGLRTNKGKSTEDSKLRLKLLRAGLDGENIVPVFWGTKILLATVFAMVFLVLCATSLKTMILPYKLYLTLLVTLLGLKLPDIWLRIRTKRRRERIARGFPDALDLLVVCVEAGMGLNAAINRVGEEVALPHPELSAELKLVNLELRAGKARRSALKNLGNRTDIEDVKNLVTLLIQTDRFGTSVAQTLRVYSDSFRTTRYLRAEELAAKMGTKLIFPLAFCFFPAFFVVGVGPAIIQIYKVFI